MSLAETSAQLEAAADPSRLRLLVVLRGGEAAVAELTAVLGQSQPRVSRHLRLLTEGGLVEHFREGRYVYYRLTAAGRMGPLGELLARLAAADDPEIAADQARLAALRRRRERDGLAATLAVRAAGQPSDSALAAAFEAVLGTGPLGDVLDVGVGAGTVLRLLAPRARSAVGVDRDRAMRELARARLHQAGLPACTVRDAPAHRLPFGPASFDLVVLDEVLTAPDAAAILAEGRRVLRPEGTLLLLGRLPPVAPAGGVADPATLLPAAGLRLRRQYWLPGRVPGHAVWAAVPTPAKSADDLPRTGTHD